jgi:hypothetical protein
MNTHVAHFGLSMRRVAPLPVPRRMVGRAPSRAAAVDPGPGWLDRLATWAEHQPMHHRMGSYTQFR